MDTTNPAHYLVYLLVLKLLCSSALSHAGKEWVFLPTSSNGPLKYKWLLKTQKWGDLIPFHAIVSIIGSFPKPLSSYWLHWHERELVWVRTVLLGSVDLCPQHQRPWEFEGRILRIKLESSSVCTYACDKWCHGDLEGKR